jgi:hypothetical protein
VPRGIQIHPRIYACTFRPLPLPYTLSNSEFVESEVEEALLEFSVLSTS